jgi:hypothetical protein
MIARAMVAWAAITGPNITIGPMISIGPIVSFWPAVVSVVVVVAIVPVSVVAAVPAAVAVIIGDGHENDVRSRDVHRLGDLLNLNRRRGLVRGIIAGVAG